MFSLMEFSCSLPAFIYLYHNLSSRRSLVHDGAAPSIPRLRPLVMEKWCAQLQCSWVAMGENSYGNCYIITFIQLGTHERTNKLFTCLDSLFFSLVWLLPSEALQTSVCIVTHSLESFLALW